MNEFCFAWIGQSEVGFGLGNGLQIFPADGWGRTLGVTGSGRSELPSGGDQSLWRVRSEDFASPMNVIFHRYGLKRSKIASDRGSGGGDSVGFLSIRSDPARVGVDTVRSAFGETCCGLRCAARRSEFVMTNRGTLYGRAGSQNGGIDE